MRVDAAALILITDGGKMLLFRNEGDAVYPNLRLVSGLGNLNRSNHEQLSDAPGVVQTSPGPRSSRYEDPAPHERNKVAFARQAAALLDASLDGREAVIIVAPPKTLSVLRDSYTAPIKDRLVAEIDKDLTKHSVDDITQHLQRCRPSRRSS